MLLRHDLSGLVLRARPMPFQVDGDWLGERESVQIWSVPSALTVIASTARPRGGGGTARHRR